MLKNGIFCEMVILVVFKVFLVIKNLDILIQIVPDSPIYYYSHQIKYKNINSDAVCDTALKSKGGFGPSGGMQMVKRGF